LAAERARERTAKQVAKRSPAGILMAAVIWLVIAGGLAAAYKYFLHPRLQGRLHQQTGSESRYRQEVRLAVDSFSGYCVLRSEVLRSRLQRQGILWSVVDDGADIPGRLRGLRDGDLEMAVFTIDSWIAAGAKAGVYPGSIVLILDETRGADAIVAYREGVPGMDALNQSAARFVATPDSPSEFLARVAVANFQLPALPSDWLEPAGGAEEVYKAFRAAPPDRPAAYVLWEPYVSRALEEPGAHVLLDSSKLSGYIMDVLVVRRDFLRDHEDVVRLAVEAYLRTTYEINQAGTMVDLVVEDAKATGAKGIRRAQAEALVAGIAWRNTLENYVQFGLHPADGGNSLPHLEDAMLRIADVLVRTGGVSSDPLRGQTHVLFYDKILRDLKAERFHPGRAVNVVQTGSGEDLGFEEIRGQQALRELSEAEWDSLATVGEMRIEPISFARGGDRLNVSSTRSLEGLASQLEALPVYYLTVVGHARAEGDAEANRKLARGRAEAVKAFLEGQGVVAHRVRAQQADPSQRDGGAQSVSFVVGQLPY
jgi:ABC-type taurine transport system substrate-binding protein